MLLETNNDATAAQPAAPASTPPAAAPSTLIASGQVTLGSSAPAATTAAVDAAAPAMPAPAPIPDSVKDTVRQSITVALDRLLAKPSHQRAGETAGVIVAAIETMIAAIPSVVTQ